MCILYALVSYIAALSRLIKLSLWKGWGRINGLKKKKKAAAVHRKTLKDF